MEEIGEMKCENLCKNEFIIEWCFKKVVFNKSYRSGIFQLNNSIFQMAIIPDNSQNTITFYFITYGYREQNRRRVTFTACLRHKRLHVLNLSSPEISISLETSMKIFETHSQHPILFTCDEYSFEFKIKFHEDLAIPSSFSNVNTALEDSKIEDTACSASFKGMLNSVQYLQDLSQDMGSLYNSGDLSDLQILIGDEILKVHKLIICARSPVFKKMMQHDCLESSSDSITITDCPILPFVKFLKYLYTGEIESSSLDTVMSLYSLGDKYDVPVLREACSNMLQTKLSSEDSVEDVTNIVCYVLQLAERHGDSKLKDLAATFIVNHFPMVSNKQGWKDLVKNDFELISNILSLVASGLHKQVYKSVNK